MAPSGWPVRRAQTRSHYDPETISPWIAYEARSVTDWLDALAARHRSPCGRVGGGARWRARRPRWSRWWRGLTGARERYASVHDRAAPGSRAGPATPERHARAGGARRSGLRGVRARARPPTGTPERARATRAGPRRDACREGAVVQLDLLTAPAGRRLGPRTGGLPSAGWQRALGDAATAVFLAARRGAERRTGPCGATCAGRQRREERRASRDGGGTAGAGRRQAERRVRQLLAEQAALRRQAAVRIRRPVGRDGHGVLEVRRQAAVGGDHGPLVAAGSWWPGCPS